MSCLLLLPLLVLVSSNADRCMHGVIFPRYAAISFLVAYRIFFPLTCVLCVKCGVVRVRARALSRIHLALSSSFLERVRLAWKWNLEVGFSHLEAFARYQVDMG